jgi:hypothetical protein
MRRTRDSGLVLAARGKMDAAIEQYRRGARFGPSAGLRALLSALDGIFGKIEEANKQLELVDWWTTSGKATGVKTNRNLV